MEEQAVLECPCKDQCVRVVEVDNLVVEHVLVDLEVLVFWNVHVVVVLEVLEHLVVALVLLFMMVKVQVL